MGPEAVEDQSTEAKMLGASPRAFLRGALAFGGIAAVLGLVWWADAGEVWRTLAKVGWLVVPLAMLHVVPLALDASAWRMLTPPPRPGLRAFMAARWVREGVNALLPAAQIGGEVIAVRMLARAGAGMGRMSALIGIDLATEFLAMALTGGAGALALLKLSQAAEEPQARLIALAMVPVALLAWVVLFAQRGGLLGGVSVRIAKRWPDAASLLREAQIAATEAWARPYSLIGAVGLHSVGWVGGAVETWIVLRIIGHPLRIEQAFALETTSEVLRSAGFIIPGLLGAQEGSIILVGGLLGLPASGALAISLYRRARDIGLGIPALLIWQATERSPKIAATTTASSVHTSASGPPEE